VDLFAMSAAASRATSRLKADGQDRSPVELADHFCRIARRRIAAAFHATKSNDDKSARRVSAGVLERRYDWLEAGILESCPEAGSAGEARVATVPGARTRPHVGAG
jgi:hypothetical protein